MRARAWILSSLATSVTLIATFAAGCGSENGSTFDNGDGGDGGGLGDVNVGDAGSFDDGGNPITTLACITNTAAAALNPANLIMMYDRSGSMGDETQFPGSKEQRWIPLENGMKAFISDPASANISASLQFFPNSATTQDQSLNAVCSFDYSKPTIPLSLLGQPFITAIDAQTQIGGTPTLPALTGAVAYAKTVQPQNPSAKTVVLLITDGAPGFVDSSGNTIDGCTNNDLTHVEAEAQTAFSGTPSIPVYVIGIGPALDALNGIAKAGGTNTATIVDVGDPAKTAQAFQDALARIRAAELGCDFAIPSPGDGKSLDPNQVNVVLVGSNGSQTTIGHSQGCTNPDGWTYDDPTNPKRISLCANECTKAQADRGDKLTIAFGCATVDAPIK